MRSIIAAIRHNLRNLARFSGREGRTSFWLYAGATYVLFQVLSVVIMFPLMFMLMGGGFPSEAELSSIVTTFIVLGVGFMVAWAALLAAAAVRRLHDRGLTGWIVLLPLPFYAWAMSQMPDWMTMFVRPQAGLDFSRLQALMLANLAFYAALGVLVLLLALPGQKSENRYGPPVELESD